jgi:putative transposase
MSESIMEARKFRTFNVMNDCTQEALAIEIDISVSPKRIIRTIGSVIAWRGKPTDIRTDNGPEFTSKVLSGDVRSLNRDSIFSTR